MDLRRWSGRLSRRPGQQVPLVQLWSRPGQCRVLCRAPGRCPQHHSIQLAPGLSIFQSKNGWLLSGPASGSECGWKMRLRRPQQLGRHRLHLRRLSLRRGRLCPPRRCRSGLRPLRLPLSPLPVASATRHSARPTASRRRITFLGRRRLGTWPLCQRPLRMMHLRVYSTKWHWLGSSGRSWLVRKRSSIESATNTGSSRSVSMSERKWRSRSASRLSI